MSLPLIYVSIRSNYRKDRHSGPNKVLKSLLTSVSLVELFLSKNCPNVWGCDSASENGLRSEQETNSTFCVIFEQVFCSGYVCSCVSGITKHTSQLINLGHIYLISLYICVLYLLALLLSQILKQKRVLIKKRIVCHNTCTPTNRHHLLFQMNYWFRHVFWGIICIYPLCRSCTISVQDSFFVTCRCSVQKRNFSTPGLRNSNCHWTVQYLIN